MPYLSYQPPSNPTGLARAHDERKLIPLVTKEDGTLRIPDPSQVWGELRDGMGAVLHEGVPLRKRSQFAQNLAIRSASRDQNLISLYGVDAVVYNSPISVYYPAAQKADFVDPESYRDEKFTSGDYLFDIHMRTTFREWCARCPLFKLGLVDLESDEFKESFEKNEVRWNFYYLAGPSDIAETLVEALEFPFMDTAYFGRCAAKKARELYQRQSSSLPGISHIAARCISVLSSNLPEIVAAGSIAFGAPPGTASAILSAYKSASSIAKTAHTALSKKDN